MFTRQVGRCEVNDFVAALWIFRKCSGVGRTAQIRWGTRDVEIEPRGAESRSILPMYVSKNGTACVSDIPVMWNPLHSHIRTSKIKTFRFSSASPSKYHFCCMCIQWRVKTPGNPSHHHFPHSQRMATLPNWRPPRWYSAVIPTSVSLLLVHSLACEALFWGSYSWNSQNSILTKCHRPKLQSISATIAQKSSGAIE